MRALNERELQEHNKDLSTLGYTVIRSCFPSTELAGMREQLESLFASGRTMLLPGGTVVPCVQNLGAHYIDLITAPPIEALLMEHLNDPYYRELPQERPNYFLSEYIARCTAGKLRLHIDSFIPFPGKRTFMMQVAIALDTRSEENGCTVVVPGTHASGSYTDREYTRVTALPLAPGDVAIWDARLWHGTTEQTAERRAWLLVATFNMWFIKARFDATKSVPSDIYARLSDSQKAVLGFCSVPPSEPAGDQRYRKGYEVL